MSAENEPFSTIRYGNETVPVHRDNLSLIMHLGKNAVYDHCHIDTGLTLIRIWRFEALFEKYAGLAQKHNSYIVLNKSTPHPQVVADYMYDATRDLANADTSPVDWSVEK